MDILEKLIQDKPNLMAESSHYEGTGQESYLHFYIDKTDVNFINRILEGYEYVGVMTSVDNEGHQMIRCTPDTRDLAIEILKSLGDKILRIDAMA